MMYTYNSSVVKSPSREQFNDEATALLEQLAVKRYKVCQVESFELEEYLRLTFA